MSKQNKSFGNEIADQSRSCMNALLEQSPAYEAMSAVTDMQEVSYEISSAGNSFSRQTLMDIPVSDLMAISDTSQFTGNGIPEVTVELSSQNGELVFKVLETKNMALVAALKDEERMPAFLVLNGPQSLPGTGIFSLCPSEYMPSKIVSKDGKISVGLPTLAVSPENLGLDEEELANVAAAMDGIISVGSSTPYHEVSAVSDALNKALSWAEGKERRGDIIQAMPPSLLMDRAIRIASSLKPEQTSEMSHGM